MVTRKPWEWPKRSAMPSTDPAPRVDGGAVLSQLDDLVKELKKQDERCVEVAVVLRLACAGGGERRLPVRFCAIALTPPLHASPPPPPHTHTHTFRPHCAARPSPRTLACADSVTRYNKCIADAEMALSEATGKTGKQLKQLRELQASVKTLTAQPGDPAASRDYGERLSECGLMLARVKSIEPDTGSLFVRLFLGQVNVRVASKEDRGRLKDEYEKFRFRTNFGFIIFPLIWILDFWYLRSVWKYTYWLYILTHVWLLYYYVSLALRTNILKVVRCINSPTPPPPFPTRALAPRPSPSAPTPFACSHPLTNRKRTVAHKHPEWLPNQGVVDLPPLRQRLYGHCGAHVAPRVPQL